MSLTSRRDYLGQIRGRYQRAGRIYKQQILNEFCAICGYERKYALKLLHGQRGVRTGRHWGRKKVYEPQELLPALKQVWRASEQLCSKRLVGALPLWLAHDPGVARKTKEQLLSLSASTIDRLLRPVRAKLGPKGRCTTKPGTLLKKQIPIRTEHWDVTRPGFIEADTVAHCGNSIEGEYVWTVTLTDIHTGWTCLRAVWGRGSAGVLEQIRDIEQSLPFPILGFDCDNGSEFLNHHLVRYFQKRTMPVGFTRSRPYRKNDNAHVEQKNWMTVRQILGYERFEQPGLAPLVNTLYRSCWEPLVNCYHPVCKLVYKERLGARYRKRYDQATTPAHRLLRHAELTNEHRQRVLQDQGQNPYQLKRELERRLKSIFNQLRCPPF